MKLYPSMLLVILSLITWTQSVTEPDRKPFISENIMQIRVSINEVVGLVCKTAVEDNQIVGTQIKNKVLEGTSKGKIVLDDMAKNLENDKLSHTEAEGKLKELSGIISACRTDTANLLKILSKETQDKINGALNKIEGPSAEIQKLYNAILARA